MWDLVKSTYPTHAKAKTLLEFDKVLGLNLKIYLGKPVKVPAKVRQLVAGRESARMAKDWQRADEIRKKIVALGYTIEDTASGPKIK